MTPGSDLTPYRKQGDSQGEMATTLTNALMHVPRDEKKHYDVASIEASLEIVKNKDPELYASIEDTVAHYMDLREEALTLERHGILKGHVHDGWYWDYEISDEIRTSAKNPHSILKDGYSYLAECEDGRENLSMFGKAMSYLQPLGLLLMAPATLIPAVIYEYSYEPQNKISRMSTFFHAAQSIGVGYIAGGGSIIASIAAGLAYFVGVPTLAFFPFRYEKASDSPNKKFKHILKAQQVQDEVLALEYRLLSDTQLQLSESKMISAFTEKEK